MDALLLTVLKMSLVASYVILFVILLRLLLKRAPKVISYALWSVVAIRLIVPLSIESPVSLLPRSSEETVQIPYESIGQQGVETSGGIEVLESVESRRISVPFLHANVSISNIHDSINNTLKPYLETAAYVWLIGILVLLLYSLVSTAHLKKQLQGARFVARNVFEADNLRTPFVFGLMRPKIYLPAGLDESEKNYILLHENTHIRRMDHLIKLIAFVIVSIHWFNPLVWIAFRLMTTDMELSCDEKVLKQTKEDIRKTYAHSLLSLAVERHMLKGSPLAFGEGNVKGRIKNVLNYKKPKIWVVLLSALLVIVAGIGLLTNPERANSETPNDVDLTKPQIIAGYIVMEDNLVYIDEVEIITAEDKERIEELQLDQVADMPNGYYIYNENTDKQTFQLTEDTIYTFVDFNLLFVTEEDGNRQYTTTNKEEFLMHLNTTYSDTPPASKVPFFLEVKDGKVIRLIEKFEYTI